jgi:hypothetical protein
MDLKDMLKGSMKGQAVMEYLVTYGLALFVILIVLAILVAVVLPQLKAPESCQFSQPGFGCSTKQHVIFSNSSNQNRTTAILQLDNQQGRDIYLKGVICSSEPAGNINRASFRSEDLINVPMAAGATTNMQLICMNAERTPSVLAIGSSYKGSIAVLYNYQEEVSGAPERIATATISGAVQQG